MIPSLSLLALPLAPMSQQAADLLNQVDLRAPIDNPGLTTPLQLIFMLSLLTILPFLIIMTTSFMRTIIVLGFLRQAMGTQTIPPNPVLLGLGFFLAMYTMNPVWATIDQNALQPYLHKRIDQPTAIVRAVAPLQEFMLRQTNQQELAFFIRITRQPEPATPADVPLHVAIPAFMISELTTAFKILIFTLANGWHLIAQSLIGSFK